MADCPCDPEKGCSALRVELSKVLAEQRVQANLQKTQTDNITAATASIEETALQFNECMKSLQKHALRMNDGAHVMEKHTEAIAENNEQISQLIVLFEKKITHHEEGKTGLHTMEDQACKTSHRMISTILGSLITGMGALLALFSVFHGYEMLAFIKTKIGMG